jgi:thymidylate synthase (FAD)
MKVQLLRITPDAEELIAAAYGTCTNKIVVPENIQKWVKLGHESPLEHAVATFHIKGISRACLAQLTRHRLASFSVESMRYVDMSAQGQVVPDSIVKACLLNTYGKHMGSAQTLYQDMLDNGVPKEDARMVLPLATMTNLIMTANFREWRHIIGLRTSSAAQWEIRELANKALDILIKQASNVFSDLSQGKE